MDKKLRILAAGDIHGDTDLAKQLADKAEKEKVDLVILCGDITMNERSTSNLLGPFIKKHQKVLLVPGNHESAATADFLAKLYNATNLHGYSIKYKDVGLFGCSGVNLGQHQMPEKEIFSMLKKGFDYVKAMDKKIMVTHVHPSESTMEHMTNFKGSEGIRKAIKEFKPDFLLCSHIHEMEGIEEIVGKTKVINVGKKGKIIEI